MNTLLTIVQLDAKQIYLAEKISKMLIRESGDSEEDDDNDLEPEPSKVASLESHDFGFRVPKSAMDRQLIRSY